MGKFHTHTHSHTRSCNSRAHNTEIPQPGCACVRIVYSFWNIMLSILSNDMHSTRAGAEGRGQGVLLGLDRHFSYWQCLIQSVVCPSHSVPGQFLLSALRVFGNQARPQLPLLLQLLPSHSKISQQMAKKGQLSAVAPVFFGFFSFWAAKAFTVAFN